MNADGGLMTAQDARTVLGLEAPVDEVGLRRAFRRAVKACHPDLPGGDAARLRMVIAAYRRLEKGGPDRPAASPGPAPRPRAPALVISPAAAALGGVSVVMLAGRKARVALPPGLRHGDRVCVSGRISTVDIRGDRNASVIGDHLCLTVTVGASVLRSGGRLAIDTPVGPLQVWVSGGDAARGLVRVRGRGLPPRGTRPGGDLFVRLKPEAVRHETATRAKLRRFTAAWAA